MRPRTALLATVWVVGLVAAAVVATDAAESFLPRVAALVGRRPVPDFLIGAAIGVAPFATFAVAMRRGARGERPWPAPLVALAVVTAICALATGPKRGSIEPRRLRHEAPYVVSGVPVGMLLGLGLVVLATTSRRQDG